MGNGRLELTVNPGPRRYLPLIKKGRTEYVMVQVVVPSPNDTSLSKSYTVDLTKTSGQGTVTFRPATVQLGLDAKTGMFIAWREVAVTGNVAGDLTIRARERGGQLADKSVPATVAELPVATAIYGEMSGMHPQTTATPRDIWDIRFWVHRSVQDMGTAHLYLAHTIQNIINAGNTIQYIKGPPPSDKELKNLKAVRATWNSCKDAEGHMLATRNAGGNDPVQGAKHFCHRQGGGAAGPGLPAWPDWTKAPAIKQWTSEALSKSDIKGKIPKGPDARLDVWNNVQ
jgi:hypothetical protein